MPRKGKIANEKETLAYMTEVLRDGCASADERLRAGQALMRFHVRMAEIANPEPVEIVDDVKACKACVFRKFGEWYYKQNCEAAMFDEVIKEGLQCSEKK